MRHLLTITLICLTGEILAQNVWTQRDSVGGPPKSAAAAFAINQRGYVVGGLDQFEFKRRAYKYNPTTDNWSNVTSLGGDLGLGLERASAVAFTTYAYAYVGLGHGADPFFDDFWRYDPVTDSWAQVADFGGSGRTQAVAFGIGNKGYVGTGMDATGYKKDFYCYDPDLNTWTPIADFGGTPRRQAVGFAMGDQGYVGTGDDGTFRKDFWQYDPATDTWDQKADFAGTGRYGACGFGTFPKAFIGTGYDNTLNYKNDFWEYNYWTDTWTQRANLPGGPRANAIAFSLEGFGFMGSGYNGDYLDDFYIYTTIIGVEEEEALKIDVNVYPNPVSDMLTLEYTDPRLDEVAIYDLHGKMLNVSSLTSSFGKTSIDVSVLPAGNYLCLMKGDGLTLATRKITVNR